MTPFTFAFFVDTWALSSSLRGKQALFENENYAVVRDRDGWIMEAKKDWPALWNVVARLQRQPLAVNVELGKVTMSRLPPMTESTWMPSARDEWSEGHVAIVTNPQSHVFCGVSVAHLPVGHFCIVSREAPRCAVNWGETPAFTLHVEFRRKEQVDDTKMD